MIDFDLLKRIYIYSHEHTSSSLERYENVLYQKLVEDCFNGKVAEYNLYFKLKDDGYDLDEPDLEVYSKEHKSFDADLYVKNKDMYLHVKSISKESHFRYGASVLFSKYDPLIKNPDKNHWIVPMIQIDLLNYEVFAWLNSMDAVYKKTITYQPNKLAIYF